MKSIRLLLMVTAAVWFLGFAAQAQNPQTVPDKSSQVITKSVDVKNADVNRIVAILGAIARATGTTMAPDQANKLIILSGNPDRIAEMENLVRRLDVQPSASSQYSSVELTAYLLVAGETVTVGQPVPAQLEPALKQLRSIFAYKTYQLVDTLWMRNRVGNMSQATGSYPAEAEGKAININYDFRCMISHITRDAKGELIHLDSVRIETQRGSISTNVDIRPGQLVVIGKTSFQGNQALIAVITARIVD